MFNRYFQEELSHLKELGKEFSTAHPALAPMLAGATPDPDVERLLEGVAFLTALLRQKLDDEFPEIINELMQLIWPHYLRPIPSTTLIAFTPKPTLRQSLTIPPGIQIGSIPVEGTSCLFRTSYEVDVHPLTLLDATFTQPSGQPPFIKLSFELKGLKLSDWQPKALRLFLAGDYPDASDLYLLLRRHLRRILIKPIEKGKPCSLGPEDLKPVGFSEREALIPYPSHAFPGYRIIQEYFISPQKFLFLDLTGWERWQEKGEGSRFEVHLELHDLPFSAPRIKRDHFILSVTPAINLFPHEADPIQIDHRKTKYLIRPSGSNPENYQVYSVENVVGYIQGTAEERRYVPFEVFNPDPQAHPVYRLTSRQSPLREMFDLFLSVVYPQGTGAPLSETLSIQLLCTNGALPENLRVGDISLPTSSSPEPVEFKNIQPPTFSLLPPLEGKKEEGKGGENLRWRLLAHLFLNYLSLARTENLKALLEQYIFPGSRNRTHTLANRKRIEGIEGLETKPSDRLVSGILMRGQEIELKMRQEKFASQGDMYLFGSILDHFLGNYASVNHFTRLTLQEVMKGDIYQWPARLGDHPLI
ncbi:MAG: type VI secretion system protein ImpG [Deltaproteobacteria bacterium RBG_16_49_23]|nr:MAG: type VI secretion system protein ImpG [Deltaproteobacteria bacterium RBG_16_49_23]